MKATLKLLTWKRQEFKVLWKVGRMMTNQLIQIISIGTGGFWGAACRYLLSVNMSSEYAIFPVGTLTVNLLGSFTLGFFITLTMIRWNIDNNLRLAIATGFFGSFTTYSTFALETVNLFSGGYPAAAVLYVAVSFLGCFLLAFAGIRLAEVAAGGAARKDEEN